MTFRRRLGTMLGNLALVAGSLAVAYIGMGALFLGVGPAFMPGLIQFFPVAATIWWQPSAPHPDRDDYIALLGDSYAAGMGDWRAARRSRLEPYHSADVIRARTGRDVLSFGRAGAGSAEGLVLHPAQALAAERCLIFGRPRRPSEIVFYFYEGNDLDNNLTFMEEVLNVAPDAPDLAARAKRHFEAGYASADLGTCLGYFASSLRGFLDTALFVLGAEPSPDVPPNAVLVDGRIQTVPGPLQAPALELDPQELRAALVITEAGLAWLRHALPGTQVTVVLLPSVLTSYLPGSASVTIQIQHDGEEIQPAARVAAHSDLICQELSAVATRQNMRFVDSRPALRAAAHNALIHGPLDWGHFNRAGYVRLGETVAAVLTGEMPPQPCARLATEE